MEWDTAAGQAILKAADGCVSGIDDLPLCYGKRDSNLMNDDFVAWGFRPIGNELMRLHDRTPPELNKEKYHSRHRS